MLAEAVEDADHLWTRIDEFCKTRPLTDDAKSLLARSHQGAAAKAFETWPQSAMCRDESLFVAWFDAETYDIECCHFFHPTLRGKSCAVFYCCARPIAPHCHLKLEPQLAASIGAWRHFVLPLSTADDYSIFGISRNIRNWRRASQLAKRAKKQGI
jgi:hypothetical protein